MCENGFMHFRCEASVQGLVFRVESSGFEVWGYVVGGSRASSRFGKPFQLYRYCVDYRNGS